MERNNEMETSRWVDGKMLELNPEGEWRPDAAGTLEFLKARRIKASQARSRWLWATATVLAGGLGSLAFPAPRAVAQRVWEPCVGACESLFASKSGSASTAAIALTGDISPDFALTGADGSSIRLSDYRGKVVLLNFWATWCPPCRAEIPWFVEFQRTFGKQGLAVIGVSLDEDGWKVVRPYLDKQKMNYAVGIGGEWLAQKFGGVESLPETLLIGRDGRIVRRHAGIVSRSEYEREIQDLLGR
jgi:thiol-disulfide isomerase/thioredoxin